MPQANSRSERKKEYAYTLSSSGVDYFYEVVRGKKVRVKTESVPLAVRNKLKGVTKEIPTPKPVEVKTPRPESKVEFRFHNEKKRTNVPEAERKRIDRILTVDCFPKKSRSKGKIVARIFNWSGEGFWMTPTNEPNNILSFLSLIPGAKESVGENKEVPKEVLQTIDGDLVANVCVADKARGKGYSGILLKHLISVARKRGIPNLYLEVYSDNTSAIKAYNKTGFREIARYFEEGRELILMTLPIG